MTTFFKKMKRKYSSKQVTLFSIAICLLMGVGFYQYYGQIQRTIKEENENYLREISTRICSNITKTIDSNFSILNTLSSVLVASKPKEFSDIGQLMRHQKDYWNYEKVMLIDAGGVAYDFKGNKVSITGDSFLRTLSSDTSSIFPTQIIDNKESIVFTVPLKDFKIDEKNIIALATSYAPQQFDEILSMSSFNEKAYSQIVNQSGTIVIRSTSSYAVDFGYNVLKTISDSDENAANHITTLKTDMNNSKNGQYEFLINDTFEYLVYTPIGLQDWYLYTFIPVSIVNEKSDLLLQITLLLGCFLMIVFATLLIALVISFTRHKRKLESIAYIDPITGGHTIQKFYDLCQNHLLNQSHYHAIIYTNILHFKMLNDQFGRTLCDQLLVNIHQAILESLDEDEYIARYAADNFCVFMNFKKKEITVDRIAQWYTRARELADINQNVSPVYSLEYGIYIIEDNTIEIPDMIDRARLALSESLDMTSYNDNTFYSFFDEKVRQKMISEKHLEDMMDGALKEGEFQVYLQPKYLLKKDHIAGAEALVRWASKSEGMIYPDSFIPLFEKNGFIVKLDLWMFEQVCQTIDKWIQSGKEPIKISINCSRVHLKNPNFLESYKKIFKKYHIPEKYIELELTENMVFEDTTHLAKIIDDIHEIGFGCSMDDFGSGYSSLNLLLDIHVDTLKLDRIFFKDEFKSGGRSEAVIDCILNMARSLSMETVAEGIENESQIKILRHLGCDYIQGYAYAKPMPVAEFENLLFDGNQGKKVIE